MTPCHVSTPVNRWFTYVYFCIIISQNRLMCALHRALDLVLQTKKRLT